MGYKRILMIQNSINIYSISVTQLYFKYTNKATITYQYIYIYMLSPGARKYLSLFLQFAKQIDAKLIDKND